MQAVISGRAGLAVLCDTDRWFALHAGVPDQLVPCPPGFHNRLLSDGRDLIFLRDANPVDTGRRLRQECAATEALDLFLFLLDPELPGSVKEDAILELTSLYPEVEARLAGVMFARPLPTQADIEGARDLAMAKGDGRLLAFIRAVLDAQPSIRQVDESWRTIPDTAFSADGTRDQARALFVREGLFHALVLEVGAKRRPDGFLLNALCLPEVHDFPNHRTILQDWVHPFQSVAGTGRLAGNLQPTPDLDRDEATSEISKPRPESTFEIKERVDRQKKAITEAMDSRRLDRAKDFVGDLIAYQLAHGEPEYACKSLCDLAIHAQDLSQFSFQHWLTSKAIGLKPDDGWSWAQYGKALLNLNRLPEALSAYDEALIWYHSVEIKNGRAEVLKSLNRLPEALAAYDAIITDHPENVVAKNGRAEVLKSLNHLPEALVAYDAIITDHPENVVAMTGRAEVLKSLNRLSEALAAYQAIIPDHPGNVFAKTGHAEVLKSLNRLPEALAAYDAIITEHPENVVAKNGRAGVLKSLNRLPEALATYESLLSEHPHEGYACNGRASVLAMMGRFGEALAALPTNEPVTHGEWISYHIRGMILLRQKEFAEAISIFERGIRDNPRPADRDYFRAGLAIARLRQQKLDLAPPILEIMNHPALLALAIILRVHAWGLLGNQERLSHLQPVFPAKVFPAFQTLRDEIDRRYLQRLDAQQDDEWVFRREVDLLLAA